MKPEIFKPLFIEKIWGGAALKKFNKSLPLHKAIGESWEFYRKDIPVVVKLLDVEKPLSIQVHPEGKSELWYIIASGKESRVAAGLPMQMYKIRKGMFIYIPAGIVHTIFPPAVILEVSQPKLLTYRIYDWGRKRGKLDIEKGLSALKPKIVPRIYKKTDSFRCPYFSVKLIKYAKGRFATKLPYIYFTLKGRGRIGNILFKKGDTVMIPDRYSVQALSELAFFRISVPRHRT